MGPSKLAAVACAWGLRASALTLSDGSIAQAGTRRATAASAASVVQEQPVADPRPADLANWPSRARSRHRAAVSSLVGTHNLSIATFERWEDSMVSGELLDGKGWETKHATKLCSLYHESGAVGNFLDVGANIGTFTIPLADCIGGSGRVLALEAMPPTVEHLVAGILDSRLHNVDVYPYAVGAPLDPKRVVMSLNPVNKGGSTVKGVKPFTNMTHDQLQDLFYPGKKTHKYSQKVDVKEFSVKVTTGDAMLKRNPAMKAIVIAKVDIEGYEGRFIRGSKNLFTKYPPCFMTIELIPEWLDRAGTPVKEILDLLTSWDYKGVPTIADIMKPNTDAKTRTLVQRDMAKCLQRVKSYQW